MMFLDISRFSRLDDQTCRPGSSTSKSTRSCLKRALQSHETMTTYAPLQVKEEKPFAALRPRRNLVLLIGTRLQTLRTEGLIREAINQTILIGGGRWADYASLTVLQINIWLVEPFANSEENTRLFNLARPFQASRSGCKRRA